MNVPFRKEKTIKLLTNSLFKILIIWVLKMVVGLFVGKVMKVMTGGKVKTRILLQHSPFMIL